MPDAAPVTATPTPTAPPTAQSAATSAEAPKRTTQSTIQDAVDALFAEREAKEKASTATAPTDQALAPTAPTEPTTDEQPVEEPAKEEAPKEEPKPTASDLALEIARAKRVMAKAAQKKPADDTPQLTPEMLKRAAAIQAAGGDPLKEFEALGGDLAKLVQAYDNRAADDPSFADPLAAEVKRLSEKITQYEEREAQAKDEAAVTHFMREAESFARRGEETNFVAALVPHGGLENVKQRVIEAAGRNEQLTLVDSVKAAEKDLETVFEALAKTPKGKKLMAKYFPQTPKTPGVPSQQAPKGAIAPEPNQKPLTSADVIANAIDALGIE